MKTSKRARKTTTMTTPTGKPKKRMIDTFTDDEWLAVTRNLEPNVTVLEAENYVRELRKEAAGQDNVRHMLAD